MDLVVEEVVSIQLGGWFGLPAIQAKLVCFSSEAPNEDAKGQVCS